MSSEGERWTISNTNEGIIATGPEIGPPIEVARASEVERLELRLADRPTGLDYLRAVNDRLEAEAEVERLRDHADDVPEFGFSSELLDDEDYDGHG